MKTWVGIAIRGVGFAVGSNVSVGAEAFVASLRFLARPVMKTWPAFAEAQMLLTQGAFPWRGTNTAKAGFKSLNKEIIQKDIFTTIIFLIVKPKDGSKVNFIILKITRILDY